MPTRGPASAATPVYFQAWPGPTSKQYWLREIGACGNTKSGASSLKVDGVAP